MSRFDYVKYDAVAETRQALVKDKVQGLERVIDSLLNGRAKALAHTKLEECYMWIGKTIRDEQIERGLAPPQEERMNS